MIDPQGLKIIPAGARNRRNATVKILRNPIRHQIDEVRYVYTEYDSIVFTTENDHMM